MFYGLTTMEEEFYGDRIHRFIALAPCIWNDYYKWQYEETTEYYQSLYSYQDWYTSYGNQFQSTKSDLYWSEVAVENRFQQPITLEDYANGNRQSQKLEISEIKQIPIHLMILESDDSCSMENSLRIYDELKKNDKNEMHTM